MTSDVIFIHRQVSKVFRFDGSDVNDIDVGGDCGDDMCGSCGDNGTFHSHGTFHSQTD